ncbi:nucleoside diphosphate kinase [Trebouxia sp. C0010 RCD-2024]
MLRQVGRRAVQQVCKCKLSSSAAFCTAGKAYAGSTVKLLNHSKASTAAGALFAAGIAASLTPAAWAGSAEERSFIMIKPDGVNRGLVMDVLKRFEQKGYKLVAMKVIVPSKELAGKHYAEHDGKPFFPKLVDFLSSGAVVATVWEGKEVVKFGRTMIGATNPLASAPGTIRGDYGIDVGRNIIHGSDAVESAQKEIALWFKPEELAEYNVVTKGAIYE